MGGDGASSCTPAPPGLYDHDQISTSSPIACGDGHSSNTLASPGATTCAPAVPGTYDHDLNSTTVSIPCVDGYSTNTLAVSGAVNCTAAPLGLYDHDTLATTAPIECGDGALADGSGTPGYTTASTIVGWVVGQVGATGCVPVPAGWYDHDNRSDTLQLACPAGSTTNGVAASAYMMATTCTLAGLGFYDHDDVATTAPIACGPGSTTGCAGCLFVNDTTNCVVNAVGSTCGTRAWAAGDEGARQCNPAPAGYYDHNFDSVGGTPASVTPPVLCPAGSTTNTGASTGATICTAAPAGMYDHDSVSTTPPTECGDGAIADGSSTVGFTTYLPNGNLAGNGTGATLCVAAPTGFYDHDDLSITAPLECTDGSTTNTLANTGAQTCVEAPAGQYDHDGLSSTAPIGNGQCYRLPRQRQRLRVHRRRHRRTRELRRDLSDCLHGVVVQRHGRHGLQQLEVHVRERDDEPRGPCEYVHLHLREQRYRRRPGQGCVQQQRRYLARSCLAR